MLSPRFCREATKYITRVIALIPGNSCLYNTLAMAQFHQFSKLQTIKIALMAKSSYVGRSSQYYKAPSELLALYQKLGLDVEAYTMETVYRDLKDAKSSLMDFTWVVMSISFGQEMFRDWQNSDWQSTYETPISK